MSDHDIDAVHDSDESYRSALVVDTGDAPLGSNGGSSDGDQVDNESDEDAAMGDTEQVKDKPEHDENDLITVATAKSVIQSLNRTAVTAKNTFERLEVLRKSQYQTEVAVEVMHRHLLNQMGPNPPAELTALKVTPMLTHPIEKPAVSAADRARTQSKRAHEQRVLAKEKKAADDVLQPPAVAEPPKKKKRQRGLAEKSQTNVPSVAKVTDTTIDWSIPDTTDIGITASNGRRMRKMVKPKDGIFITYEASALVGSVVSFAKDVVKKSMKEGMSFIGKTALKMVLESQEDMVNSGMCFITEMLTEELMGIQKPIFFEYDAVLDATDLSVSLFINEQPEPLRSMLYCYYDNFTLKNITIEKRRVVILELVKKMKAVLDEMRGDAPPVKRLADGEEYPNVDN